MFPEYKEINGLSFGYELNGFVAFDVPKGIPFNLFDEIGDFLNNGNTIPEFDNNRNTIPEFDNNRNIIDSVYSDFVLVEYTNENIRNKDIQLINNKIDIISPLRTKEIEGDKQIAQTVGNFELNGKYYLVLNPYNPFSNETNPELGIYKGVIVNPELYFGKIEIEIDSKKDKIEDIL